MTTGFSDVVFAIAFSPDSRTLAIARGAAEPSQRFGRIELWDTESGKLRQIIKGFDGPVRSISFSPDGQTLVSGSSEYRISKIQEKARSRDGEVFGELKWWDTQTGELKNKMTMAGEGNSSIGATYSPDGKQLAVAESFEQFSFLRTGVPFDFPGRGNPAPPSLGGFGSSVYFSADMKLLDAQTGEQKFKLTGSGRPGAAVFSPDGQLVAAVNHDEVKIWNAQTGKEEHKLKGLKGWPNAIAFSHDSRVLAVVATRYDRHFSRSYIKVTGKSELRLFDVQTWKATLRMQDLGSVRCLAFSPAGKFLVIGGMLSQKDSAMPALRLLDLQSGKTANLPTGGEDFTEAVESLAIAGNGGLLAYRSGAGTVHLLDTRTWEAKQTMDETSVGSAVERPVSRFLVSVKRVLAVAFSRDGVMLSGETDQGELKSWDPRTGEVKKQLHDDVDDPSLVAVSRHGKLFAEVSNGKVLLRDTISGAKKIVPLPSGRAASAVALSANDETLGVGSGDELMLFNTSTGALTDTLTGHGSAVDRLAFSEDGRTLASADDAGLIEIWDLAHARIEKTVTAGGNIDALRFAPNGLTLASAEDRTITLWNLKTGQLHQKLQKHSGVINALAFSPDGQWLASGGDDRTVIIWETASGKSKRTLKGHDLTVTSLAFSPDGHLIASGSGNASVVLWEVKSGKLSRVLK